MKEDKKQKLMDSRERANFRRTKVWKEFRALCKRLCQGKDFLTGSKLTQRFNLHHCDQRKENYEELDPDRFLCLNQQSHDTVHFLYRAWLRDPEVLDRLKIILEKMKELSND